MLEAETHFRNVEGHRDLAQLAIEIEHDLTRRRQSDTHTSTKKDMAALTM